VEPSSSGGYNVRIREIPSSERPRERLRDLGAGALSTAELLAIILRTGSAKQSVLNLASSLLARHGGLGGLVRLSFAELTQESGLGEAKAAELQATFQLALRLNALQPEARPVVSSPADVNNLLGGEMALLDQEHLRVLLLNTRNQVTAVSEVYKGSVSSALVRPAELFREAIRQNAPSLILVHNHPSGDPSPSADDVVMTKLAVEAGKILGIDLLDHVIIGDRRFASMKQLGLAFRG
jgi:DNA repair protein RadC